MDYLFLRKLIVSVLMCAAIVFGVGWTSGNFFNVWSAADPAALTLLSISNGTLTLGLVDRLQQYRLNVIVWILYLLSSPILVVGIVR